MYGDIFLLLVSVAKGVRTQADGSKITEYTADRSDELVCYPTQRGK